jgi:hypothetical protein
MQERTSFSRPSIKQHLRDRVAIANRQEAGDARKANENNLVDARQRREIPLSIFSSMNKGGVVGLIVAVAARA